MMKVNMESAIKRYNNIMYDVCYEHSTIGTRFSENTENWNLRDMVAEADYLLSCYTESGHCRCDDRFLNKEEYQRWLSDSGRLKRFIKAYEPFVKDMVCAQGHCSRFD